MMIGKYKLLIAFVVICMLLIFIVGAGLKTQKNNSPSEITVFAASGTMLAVQEIAGMFEGEYNVKVNLNFGSSSTLARQIQEGADADVYISANEKWMDHLINSGKIKTDTVCKNYSTGLELISAEKKDLPETDLNLSDVIHDYIGNIAIGHPDHVPVGMYAKEAFEYYGVWDQNQPRMVTCSNVSEVLRFVESKQCEFGIVYTSLAIRSSKVDMLMTIAEESHSPIIFPMAICKGAGEKAEMFYGFLTSQEAVGVFKKNGFVGMSSSSPTSLADNSSFLLNGEELGILKLSAKVSFFAVLVILGPGVFLGWLFARKRFYGKSFLESLFFLPMVMPPVATGYLILKVFGQNGLGAFIERTLGLKLSFDWKGAVLVSSIMAMPLLIRAVKVSVEMIDQKIEHAALTLGSGPLKVFFTITLPLAFPGIVAGVVLSFARSLGEFGATTTFVGNIAGKTQTVSLAVHNYLQIPGQESSAQKLVLLSAVFSVSALLLSELMSKKLKANGECKCLK